MIAAFKQMQQVMRSNNYTLVKQAVEEAKAANLPDGPGTKLAMLTSRMYMMAKEKSASDARERDEAEARTSDWGRARRSHR